MSTRTASMTDALYRYLLDVTVTETPLQQRLRAETAEMSEGGMQISPEQGQFMHLLTKTIGAGRALEVGVFTGYSSIAVASALGDEGRLDACDVSEAYTNIAKRYWEEAGLIDKVRLHLGPAVETLDRFIKKDGRSGSFDMAFIDADKEQYDTYYEQSLKLLRRGGVVMFDNMLWHGDVADPTNTKPSTEAIRALNAKVCSDDRVHSSLVPIGDGLLIARKK